MSWFRVHRSGDKAFLHLGSEIGFGDGRVEDLIEQIGDAKEIELYIDSSGGCAQTANRIIAAIRGRTTTATITGRACSAAALIMLEARHIRIVEDGRVMLHCARSWQYASANEHRSEGEILDRLTDGWTDALAKRVGEPEIVREWLTDGEDHWFDADEAWHAGLVDEIIPPVPRPGTKAIASDVQAADDEPEQTAGEILPPSGNEALFFEFLTAHGPVTVSDPSKFLRELAAWGKYNVRQIE